MFLWILRLEITMDWWFLERPQSPFFNRERVKINYITKKNKLKNYLVILKGGRGGRGVFRVIVNCVLFPNLSSSIFLIILHNFHLLWSISLSVSCFYVWSFALAERHLKYYWPLISLSCEVWCIYLQLAIDTFTLHNIVFWPWSMWLKD